LISDGWKLIRLDRSVPSPGTRYELYDHVKDPLNFDNVADDHPEIVDRLAEQIEAWRKFAIAAKLDDAKATEEMDSEELERLRSLGYVE
jgi:hypothetical protein